MITENDNVTKIGKSPYTALFPCPVVLVTSIDNNGKPNIMTVTWTGMVCTDPPILSLGIRSKPYSHRLVERSGEFVVNVPTTEILEQTDLCGMVSGKDVNKFSETGFTAEPAKKVKPPLIKECPVNIECKVKKKISLGSHDLFLGEIVHVNLAPGILNEQGKIDFSKVSLFVYNQGEYWSLDKKIGLHGFSTR
jgi:flavin reductase (DIM6/NTAB) family NADH-FMN oxidoreductase RutF